MKKIMLVGQTGAGKTTLCQALYGEELRYQKTQAVEIIHSAIDTPGEYLENRRLYHALIVTAAEADLVVLLQNCADEQCWFAPGFAGMFGKPVIGLVTKTDLAENENVLREAEEKLNLAGCQKIFQISSTENIGIREVKTYIGLA